VIRTLWGRDPRRVGTTAELTCMGECIERVFEYDEEGQCLR
jgi:hypothetical protein